MKRILSVTIATFLLALALIPLLPTPALAQDQSLELPDPEGTLHKPFVAGDKKGIVFFFVSPYCPTANNCMPEIGKIAAEYEANFACYIIHSDPDTKATDAYQQAVMNHVKSTVLLDKEQALAKKLKAKITPETVVLSPLGEVMYQGRINDWYLGPTKKQRKATTRDLRDALDAIQSGKPIAVAKTEAIGCKIGGLE